MARVGRSEHPDLLIRAAAAAMVVAVLVGCAAAPIAGPELPPGYDVVTIEVARSSEGLTLAFPNAPRNLGPVFICPAVPAGRGDEPGIMHRIRAAGCVEPPEVVGPSPPHTNLRFESIGSSEARALTAARHWLVILVTVGGEGGGDSRALAGWIPGQALEVP